MAHVVVASVNHEGQDAERIPLNLEQKETVDQFEGRIWISSRRRRRKAEARRGGAGRSRGAGLFTSQVVNCETSVSGSQWQFAVPLSSVAFKPAMNVSLAALPQSRSAVRTPSRIDRGRVLVIG
jgi:hypothetical protein